MTELVITLVVLRILQFIKIVFFGEYPSGPMGMGY
jgi:hypothetical protein